MLSLTCPECQAQLTLPARRLLVRIDPGSATSGELLFTCLACRHTVTLDLDVRGVAAALGAGITHLSLADLDADADADADLDLDAAAVTDAVTDPVSSDSEEC